MRPTITCYKQMSFALILALYSLASLAGSGHDHGDGHEHGHEHTHGPVDQATASQNAAKIVVSLADKNKIDSSWKTVKLSSISKKEFNGRTEWVAVFVNKSIADTSKQSLYIFLSAAGQYVAANYSGK